MFTKKSKVMLWSILGLCLALREGTAADVTLEFTGSVGRVDDPAGLLGGQVKDGDRVSVSLRYDLSTPDFYPEDPTRGEYEAPGWLKFEVNGLRFERTTGVQVSVLHHFQDQEYFHALAINQMTQWPTSGEISDFNTLFLGFWQIPPEYNMFANDSLPTAVDFSLANYSHSFVTMSSQTGGPYYGIYFNLVPVPEPATWALLGLGLAGVCWRVRRR